MANQSKFRKATRKENGKDVEVFIPETVADAYDAITDTPFLTKEKAQAQYLRRFGLTKIYSSGAYVQVPVRDEDTDQQTLEFVTETEAEKRKAAAEPAPAPEPAPVSTSQAVTGMVVSEPDTKFQDPNTAETPAKKAARANGTPKQTPPAPAATPEDGAPENTTPDGTTTPPAKQD